MRGALDTLPVLYSRPPSHCEHKNLDTRPAPTLTIPSKIVAHTERLHSGDSAKIEAPERALELTGPSLTAQELGERAQASAAEMRRVRPIKGVQRTDVDYALCVAAAHGLAPLASGCGAMAAAKASSLQLVSQVLHMGGGVGAAREPGTAPGEKGG